MLKKLSASWWKKFIEKIFDKKFANSVLWVGFDVARYEQMIEKGGRHYE